MPDITFGIYTFKRGKNTHPPRIATNAVCWHCGKGFGEGWVSAIGHKDNNRRLQHPVHANCAADTDWSGDLGIAGCHSCSNAIKYYQHVLVSND